MNRLPSSIFGRVSHLAVVGSILVLVVVLSNCGKSQPPPPPLVISPSSLPNLSTGDAVALPLVVNGGVAPYHWSVGSGSLPHGLSLSAPGAVAVITGTPDTVAQAVNFTMQVTDSSGGSGSQPYTVSVLLGGDSMTFSPPSLYLGGQLVATTSAQQTVTVTNAILSPITISGVAIGGTDSSEFAESTTCNSTLAAGASCTIGVVFTPAQVGQRSASITITDDTQGSPHSLALGGTGVVSGANATLSPTSISFGTVAVGDTSEPLEVKLINYGNATLDVAGFVTTADFSATAGPGGCSALAPLSGCAVLVTFSPTSSGNVNGTLSVTDNGTGNPQPVALTGSGYAGKCVSRGKACNEFHHCCPGLTCTYIPPGPGAPPTGSSVCQ